MLKQFFTFLLVCVTSMLQGQQALRLATYQYADNDRIKNITPLAGYLQQQCGYTVTVKSYPTVHAFIEAIRNNETDIALINTFGYLLLEASDKKYSMYPALTLSVQEDARDNYKTCLVAVATSPITTLQQIQQYASSTRMMLVAPGSTSGNLVPRLALSSAGIPDADKQFASMEYGKTHIGALQGLLKGDADLAAMGYTEYMKLQKDTAAQRLLRLVWLSPEIPLGPVLIHTQLSRSVQQQIVAALLHIHQDNATALESLKAGWSEAKQATHYIRIKGSYYNTFKKILGKQQDLQRILTQFAN